MNINRNNYEEYFILYLDNELDSEDRLQVEAFAQENADLKAELDMLLQSKLTPDADISFSDKGSLMRFGNTSIGLGNYEEWLIAYIDNELTKEERKDVEVFIAGNPTIQRELNILQKTKLQAETIVFPYKESLYHKEEKVRVVAIRWWRIAAAAVLLLGISTTAIVIINNKKDNGAGGIVKEQLKEEKPTNNPVKQPEIKTQVINDPIADVDDQKKNEYAIKGASKEVVKQTIKQKENKEQTVSVKKDDQPLIASGNKEDRPTNNLTKPDNNPYVTGQGDPNNDATASTNIPKETLTNTQENMGVASVTPGIIQTSHLSTPDDAEGVEKSGGNKGLRGFLRKVTRTFEKRTNIKATNDDDRLLIAGLSIKMN